jgi:hypothetical protein
MKQKIVKINEDKLELLVKKILKEEDGSTEETQKPSSTLTRHPAYPIIDRLEDELDILKTGFRKDIANKVSGEDGYHSDIDKFNSDFNKFISKVADLKGKINNYTIETKNRKSMEEKKAMEERKKMDYQKRNRAIDNGEKYTY